MDSADVGEGTLQAQGVRDLTRTLLARARAAAEHRRGAWWLPAIGRPSTMTAA